MGIFLSVTKASLGLADAIIPDINGNVGIGTTTPGTLLQVNGLTTIGGGIPPNHVILADGIFVNSSPVSIDKLVIFGKDATIGLNKSPHLIIHNEDRTTGNSGLIVWTSDNNTNNEIVYAAIDGIAGARTSDWFAGELAFYTRKTLTNTLSERLRIDSNGNVDCASIEGALIVNRLTTTQRDAINPISNGMVIYNTTTSQFNFRENGAWVTK